MSDQPEPLDAIVAEMREAGRSDEHADGPLIEDYADRIEAAAKFADAMCRKNEEAAFKRGQAAAPGNAAAMREALEEVLEKIDAWRTDGSMEHWQYSQLFDICDAALAAPARNCDRPECADVESAWATYCAETNRADCKEFARWLFDTAEGGAE